MEPGDGHHFAKKYFRSLLHMCATHISQLEILLVTMFLLICKQNFGFELEKLSKFFFHGTL
jgi:hypothetical protein